ncbi:MAG: hypothetical protein CVV44_09590 [Spirochaetae bacterium HGW-Spirochaetae-1]|jgi:tetratricopeptide (TPR) repeat protein|nr:MAG: hypothetical protein CVV44_09590 [Spirochaetae bacterium HGW-Spirochaetae-1]
MADIDLNGKIRDFLDSALKKFIVRDYNEAIRDLKAAEVLDRYNPEILYNLAVNYARMGLHKTAGEYFERIINLPTTFVDILDVKKLYAYAQIKLKNYERAQQVLDDVIKISPGDTAAHNMKGFCLEKEGRYDEAVLAYRAIIEIDKKNSNAYNSLACILAENGGDLSEALRFARLAYDADRSSAAYNDTMGFVLMKRGEKAQAEKFILKALQIQPWSGEIKEHLNTLRGNQG